MYNRIDYLDTVCAQIRFRAAHKTIRGELEAHIDDRMAEGKSEAAAIAAMGDAVQTGKALSSIHKPRIEWRVVLCMLLLSAASVVVTMGMTGYGNMTYSSSLGELAIPMIISVIIAGGIYFIDYSLLIHFRYVCYGAALLYAVIYWTFYAPFDSASAMGWLPQIPLMVTPLLFFIGLIGIMEKNKDRGLKGIIVVTVLSVLAIIASSRIAENYSFLLMIALLSAAAPVFGRAKRSRCLAYAGLIIVAYVVSSISNTYVYHFQSIDFSVDSANSQVENVLKSSNIIGPSSFYMGEHAYDLESSHTYFIVIGMIGAYGWLVGFGVALISGGLCALMLKRSLQIVHTYGRMLAIGISSYFVARFVLAMFTNFGLFDSFCSLPFLSFGRYEYLSDAVLMGIFLSVWRRSTFMKDSVKETAGLKATSVPVK